MSERGGILKTLGDGELLEADAEAGRVVLAFTAKPEFCHSGGIVQGGFVTGWLDSAMAHAGIHARGEGTRLATLEVKVSFLRATGPGQRVRAEGWVERMGRSVAFLAARLTDEEGKLIATASSTARVSDGFENG